VQEGEEEKLVAREEEGNVRLHEATLGNARENRWGIDFLGRPLVLIVLLLSTPSVCEWVFPQSSTFL
jgi:hypothetical protein